MEMSMKPVGIVICNYNKKEFIINCVESILSSDFQEFDLYVVDNASEDDSVPALEASFGNQIHIIKNEKNLGGAGGFNTGIRICLEKGYPYVMCVDNDIWMEKENIGTLYQYLKEHTQVGAAGSKILFMDMPERIQTYGALLDFENYQLKDCYRNYLEQSELPKTVLCDYLPACSLMVRADVIKKIGLMPEEVFIYWDDMEWGYRIRQAGYQVVALGNAKVWHKGNGANHSTFSKYYMWRNRIRFFAKYEVLERLEQYTETILGEFYRTLYACYLKGEINLIETLMYAYDDALHNITGKAEDYKILKREKATLKWKECIKKKNKILILFDGNLKGLQNLLRQIELSGTKAELEISLEQSTVSKDTICTQFPGLQIKNEASKQYDLTIQLCPHIFDVENPEITDSFIYVDEWGNSITDETETRYCKDFKLNLELFIHCQKNLFYHKIMELRGELLD